MSLPVRCRCCGAVRVYEHGEWRWRLPKPGEQWRGTATCNLCGPVLARDRQRRRDRSERATERRIAKGYGQPAEGEDVFEGMREKPHEDCDCIACRPWTS